MELRVLGTIAVVRDGEARSPAGAKERAVLARLLVDPGRPVTVDALLDAVWDEADHDAAARSLRVRVSRLRRFLEPGRRDGSVLARDHAGYRLAVDPGDVDAHRFERAVHAAEALAPAAALERLDEALSLWRGPPFADLPDDPAARAEARRLEQVRRGADEARARALVELGRLEEALPALERLVEEEPLREQVVRAQMVALYSAGRQADALAAYRALAERLLELGLQPVPETRALERRILEQDPGLAARPAERPGDGLAGRTAELDLLLGALTAARGGERRTVLVGGEEGVGKTALVETFLARASESEPLLVAAGQCHEHTGSGEPYQSILDALASLARDPAADGAVEILATRAPTWLAQLPWLVAGALAEAVERRARGATPDRMLRELLEALDALAGLRPVVLVLEDLHWADGPSLDAVAALARRRPPGRLLTVGTYSSSRGDADRVRRLAGELALRGAGADVVLGRLPAAALAELVARRLPGGAPAEVAAALVRRTGGNPLFARLLLDHWVRTGALQATGTGIRVAGDLSVGVPLTLRAHLEHQLAALGPGDAELLAAAAVAGPRFAPATVAAALERPEAEVAERCAALARRTPLLEAVPAGYAFAHELEREVFRDALQPARRAELHARIGRRLAADYGATATEHSVELARHFVSGGDPGRAMRLLRAAAERAFAGNAPREGIRRLRAALDAAAELPAGAERVRAEVELHAQLGQALVAVEGWGSPAAEKALATAREAAATLDDSEPLVAVLLALATLSEVRGEEARAQRLTEECLRLAAVDARGARLLSEELLAGGPLRRGALMRALERSAGREAVARR